MGIHYVCLPLLFVEGHILEDVNKCISSLNENDSDSLDRTAGAIRGRCARVCNVVTAEMENCQPGVYSDRVNESVSTLREQGQIYKQYQSAQTLPGSLVVAYNHRPCPSSSA